MKTQARRGVRWLVGLVCVVTALCGAFFVYVTWMFDSFEASLGLHALDADGAAQALATREIVVPDGFAFADGTALVQFSGKDSYRARYTATQGLPDAERQLARANPDFPGFRRAACSDEIIRTDFTATDGFTCDATTELAVSTRSGSDVLTDHYTGTPSDAESLVLIRHGTRTELFVLAQGH